MIGLDAEGRQAVAVLARADAAYKRNLDVAEKRVASVRKQRLAAVAEARAAGLPYSRIAAVLGVSPARAEQLASAAADAATEAEPPGP